MDGLLPALRWLMPIVLAALLVVLTGCQAPGEQGTPVPAVVNAVQEATVSPTAPRSATVTATPAADLPVAPVAGARAPDFSLPNLNGEEVSLGDLRGQAVLLNFWATW